MKPLRPYSGPLTFVTSFRVNSGMSSNFHPATGSCVQVAAFLLGGYPHDYVCSTERNNITRTAWLAVKGSKGCAEYADDLEYAKCPQAGYKEEGARSALVRDDDNGCNKQNYVFYKGAVLPMDFID